PLVRGRLFTSRDVESSPPVAILNDAAARRYWPDENPIGRRISLGDAGDWREIVGIVGDTRHESLDADAHPAAVLPHRHLFTRLGEAFERPMTIVVGSSSETAATAAALRTAAAAVDPQVSIGGIRTMDDLIADTVAPRRLNFLLVTAFALLALVLTAAGLYG